MDIDTRPETLTRDSLIRLSEVSRHTGLRSSAIYQRVKDGTFPAPFKLGSQTSAWKWGEVLDWIRSRPRVEPKAERGAA